MFQYKTFYELFEKKAEQFKDKTFMINASDDTELTYEQVHNKCNKIAGMLINNGVKKSDIVSVLIPNIPEWLNIFFAPMKIGAILNVINYKLTSRELKYILNNCQSKILLVHEQLLPNIKEIKDGLKYLKKIIVIGKKEEGYLSYEDELNKSTNIVKNVKIDSDDPALLVYSSGSTGNPKGILLSHKNILSWTEENLKWVPFTENDIYLCVQAIYYVDYLYYMWLPLCMGGKFILTERFSKSKFWYYVDKYKPTFVNVAPTMLAILMNPPEDVSNLDVSSLKYISCSGEPLSIELVKRWELTFPGKIHDSYGMSECGLLTWTEPDIRKRKLGSIGKAMGYVKLKIIDKNGKECKVNETGELVAKGQNVMLGYINDEKRTKEVIKNGWIYTGDLIYVNNEGYYHIVGRIKNIIKRGAEMISPEEIETVLKKYPKVAETVVIGIPDKIVGEEVKAFIVCKEKATEDEIRYYCKKNLAKFKIPKYIQFLDALPKHAHGKIDRGKLRKL